MRNINIAKHVSSKVQELQNDTLYDYAVFEDIPEEKRQVFRKAMSRLAEDGSIVKVGSKKFYKRGYREHKADINHFKIKADPYLRKLLRAKAISATYLKAKLHKNLFWSNPNGMIPIENVISKIISEGSLSDLDFARFNFGDDRVIEVFLKYFNIEEKPMIRKLLNV